MRDDDNGGRTVFRTDVDSKDIAPKKGSFSTSDIIPKKVQTSVRIFLFRTDVFSNGRSSESTHKRPKSRCIIIGYFVRAHRSLGCLSVRPREAFTHGRATVYRLLPTFATRPTVADLCAIATVCWVHSV